MKLLVKPLRKKLYWTACWHIGNKSCRERKIQEMINNIKRDGDNAWWALGGDMIEAISPLDKRYCAASTEKTITQQFASAYDYIKQSEDNFLGFLYGNHEYSLRVGGDYLADILGHIGLKTDKYYLGGVVGVNFVGKRNKVVKAVLAHSDFTWPRTLGVNPASFMIRQQIRLRTYLLPWAGDLKLIAHAHHSLVAPPLTVKQLEHIGSKLAYPENVITTEWCAVCPSMFASYDDTGMPSYAEVKMYPPTEIGYLVVEFDTDDTAVKTIKEVLT